MSSFTSSGSDPKWIYDVFISFRGVDTRKNFVSHLYSALSSAGVNTFIDDEKLDKGLPQQVGLHRAIEGSQIFVIVFSEAFAASNWCLDELEKIMECHKTTGKMLIPIFYGVDPSHVRKQKGTFGEAFERLLRAYPWMAERKTHLKTALTEAANTSGWNVSNYRNESKVVKKIVDDVLAKLSNKYLPITDFPVGLESHVEEVIQFLKRRSRKVRIVGIWGMGGIGKTTTANAIYNQIRSIFVDRSFLANIREVWEMNRGPIDLQKQLLSDILKIKKIKIHSIELGKTMIRERLCSRRALLILDDVNKFEQLNALCGNRTSIGAGSVIIVTTRDVHLLNILKVDYIHRMQEMDHHESLQLFSWHAFRESSPREDFIELSRNVVAYCEGLPLALEVLGSYLYERTKEEWKSVLSKLERIPNNQIQEKLKISYDGLTDHMEKYIFLDICCFFIGMDKTYVTEILNGCGLHAEIGIIILIERSLIKVEKNNKLEMHSLLRDMGREIVCEDSPEEPEKRSRLWFHKDVLDVLTEHTGTTAVEGLALKVQRTSRICFSAKAFEKMKRLRLLQLDHAQIDGDYGYLSKHLRWISWQGFHLKYIPDNFCQGNIVAIDLKHSNLILVWKKPQLMEMLKILNLSHSRYLTHTPDFSKLPNLQKLILKDCPSLSEVHQSIGNLNNLLLLNLKGCTSLNNLPMTTYKLKSLKTLILSGCSKIDVLEEDIVQMESLTTLIADHTSVKQVPFSIVRSKSIGYISLCGYEGLAHNIFPSLIWSWMSPTTHSLSCSHPFWGMLSSLVSMDLQNVNLDDLSPMLSGLSKLRSFWVKCHSESQLTQELRRILDDTYHVNFTQLETTSYAPQILERSLESLLIGMGGYGQVFEALSQSISQVLTTTEPDDFFLAGDNYPYWITHTGEGNSVLFTVPRVHNCCLKGIALCVVYSSTTENMAAECPSILIVNYTKCIIQLYKCNTVSSFNDEDWQGIVSNLGLDDKVEFFVAFGHGLSVKKTAVYLIFGESIEGNSKRMMGKWRLFWSQRKWLYKTKGKNKNVQT